MINKKSILITGGSGFVGSNLIKLFLKRTKFNIISLDNYSSGSKKNHIKNSRVKYLQAARNVRKHYIQMHDINLNINRLIKQIESI